MKEYLQWVDGPTLTNLVETGRAPENEVEELYLIGYKSAMEGYNLVDVFLSLENFFIKQPGLSFVLIIAYGHGQAHLTDYYTGLKSGNGAGLKQ